MCLAGANMSNSTVTTCFAIIIAQPGGCSTDRRCHDPTRSPAVPVADRTTATRRLVFWWLDSPWNAIALRVHAIAERCFDRSRSWPVSRTQPLSGDILAIAQTRRSFDMRAFCRSLGRLVYSRPCAGVVIVAVCIGVALRQRRAASISASVAPLPRAHVSAADAVYLAT
jgi:hypothetical protein